MYTSNHASISTIGKDGNGISLMVATNLDCFFFRIDGCIEAEVFIGCRWDEQGSWYLNEFVILYGDFYFLPESAVRYSWDSKRA